jgi:hypothetical protein
VFKTADVPSQATRAKGLDRRHMKRSPTLAELDPPLPCRGHEAVMKLSPARGDLSDFKFQCLLSLARAIALVRSYNVCSMRATTVRFE